MATKRSLALYLRGHHAAGAAAVGQVRRSAAGCRDGELGLLLVRLSKEIADDCGHLAEVMTKLGVTPARLRTLVVRLVAWIGRWFVRAHAPGRPQALLIGLESLSLGIEGKASLWRTLREVSVGEPRIGDIDFDTLLARAEEQRRLLEPHRLEVALQANANSYSNGSRVTAKGVPHHPDPDEIPTPSSLAGAAAPSRTAAASREAAVSASTAARRSGDDFPAVRPAPSAADPSSDATQVIGAVSASPPVVDRSSADADKAAASGASDDSVAATQLIRPVSPTPAAEAAPVIGALGARTPHDAATTGASREPGDATPAVEGAGNDRSSQEATGSASIPADVSVQSDEDGEAPSATSDGTGEDTSATSSSGEAGATDVGAAEVTSPAADPGASASADDRGTAEDAPPNVEPSHEAVAAYLAGVSLSAREAEGRRPEETVVDGVAVDAAEAEADDVPAKPQRKRAPAKTKAEPKAARSRAKAKPKAKGPAAVAAGEGDPAPGGTVFVAPAAKPSPSDRKVFVPRPKVGAEKPAAATKASLAQRPARRKPRSPSEPQRVVIDPKKLETLSFEAIPGEKKPPPTGQP